VLQDEREEAAADSSVSVRLVLDCVFNCVANCCSLAEWRVVAQTQAVMALAATPDNRAAGRKEASYSHHWWSVVGFWLLYGSGAMLLA